MKENQFLNRIFAGQRLISLYELMKKFHINWALFIEHAFTDLATVLDFSYTQKKDKPIDVKTKRLHAIAFKKSLSMMEHIKNYCKEKDFPTSEKFAISILKYLSDKDKNLTHVEICFQNFRTVWENELKEYKYFSIHPEEKKQYDGIEKFAAEISDIFPSLQWDFEEAAKCILFERYTACAYHSIRILEVGVQHLAKKLKVGLLESNGRHKDWHKLLDEVSPIISAMNTKTEVRRKRAASYNKILSHLYEVKDERNDIMHPKKGITKQYSKPKAEQILFEAKGFIGDYAEFLRASKPKNKLAA